MAEPVKRVCVFIVSDATGITAERVTSAVLTQFKPLDIIYERFPFVATEDELASILAKAEYQSGVVVYSLASEVLRKAIARMGESRKVELIDLMGPLLQRISRYMNRLPALRPGRLEHVASESVRLAESIDFTLSHDDGQRTHDLDQANLLLLGVSRTSKTPTSLFLSCNHGIKVANIPIIKDIDPPQEVFDAPCRKIGFTISPSRLAFIRRRRFKEEALPGYSDVDFIKQELLFCQRVFQRVHSLTLIDVTNTSIEEVANRIMN